MKSVGITTGVRKILASVDACVSPTKRYISDRNDSTEGKMKKPKFKGTEAEEMKEVHQQNSSKRIRKNKYEESELNCTSGDISSSGKMSIKAFFHPASKKQ